MVKQMSKFNEHEAQVLLVWIAQVTGECINTGGNAGNFAQQLKDGVLLCKLANTFAPTCIGRVNTAPRSTFACMSNIDSFLMACQREFGMPTEQLFRSVDLTEGRDLFSVTMTLNALARKAREKGLTAPDVIDRDKFYSNAY